MHITIIDYGSGNLHSASKAFLKAGEASGAKLELTSDPDRLRMASHIVLPGVGAYGDCIAGLRAIDGMIEAMQECVLTGGRPFLGICVGMQLMLDRGLEYGEHRGLGWIGGDVIALDVAPLKVPHMGWNTLTPCDGYEQHPLFRGLGDKPDVYFVHSFHAACHDPSHRLATTDYGVSISACIGRDNLLGTQFHPEKSGMVGLKLIENFLSLS